MIRRTRVKICGFTRPADAVAAVRMGADAIGLVFYPPSPRHVSVEIARAIVTALPPFVTVVGLFVDEDPETVLGVLDQVRIDLLQFHGDEDPAYCTAFAKPYIKALPMKPGVDLAATMAAHGKASGFLLDAWHPDAMGGTGSRFDWNLIPPEHADALILAGGLEPGNVAEALRTVRPYALDVSSGVEAAKGIKDADKMAAFLTEVQRFDYQHHVERTL
ncbi:MAG: phosphoribosylanthranilate isomerase [Methylomagnum sp.]